MTFVEQLHCAVAAAGERPLFYQVRGTALEATSGAELMQLIAGARGYLAAHGIKPGDRVGLCGANSARWAAADLAVLGSGALGVPLYPRQAMSELVSVLRDAGAALVLVENIALRDQLAAAWPDHGTLGLFDDVFANAPGEATPHTHTPDEWVSLIYTSGTSGEPKGVLYSAANVDFVLARASARMQEMVAHHQGRERMFHYLPFCFASSRITLWVQLLRRSPLYLSSEIKALPQELAVAQPHYFLNVPAMLERIRKSVDEKLRTRGGLAFALYRATVAAYLRLARANAKLGDRFIVALGQRLVFRRIKQQLGAPLEFLICGSAPLSAETQHWFALLGIPVYQVYGLTETTAIVTMDEKGRTRPGHVGRPIADVELRLANDGELLCRGGNIFPAYWQRPDASGQALESGWFHTGDLAALGPDGDLEILGRVKDLLVLESGFKAPPDPLEAALSQHAGGAQVIVIGHGRPHLAALFAGDLDAIKAQQALDRVNLDLPRAKQIRRFGVVREPWSNENGLLTANLKLKRRAIENRFASEIQALYL